MKGNGKEGKGRFLGFSGQGLGSCWRTEHVIEQETPVVLNRAL